MACAYKGTQICTWHCYGQHQVACKMLLINFHMWLEKFISKCWLGAYIHVKYVLLDLDLSSEKCYGVCTGSLIVMIQANSTSVVSELLNSILKQSEIDCTWLVDKWNKHTLPAILLLTAKYNCFIRVFHQTSMPIRARVQLSSIVQQFFNY